MGTTFFEEYLHTLIEYNQIPKLQIERAIAPLLSIFIEEIIKQHHKKTSSLTQNIELIAPEFPLKKDNNQSTNIDWLLIDKTNLVLYFIELKTAGSSFNAEQLCTYKLVHKFIQKFGAGFLYDDLRKIRNKSIEKSKYDFVINKCEPFRECFKKLKEVEVIYIVPTEIKNKLTEVQVLPFCELPEYLDHEYSTEWKLLRDFLMTIDRRDKITDTKPLNPEANNDLIKKLVLISEKYNKEPELIWFGILGEGSHPNFQIQFTDGSVIPFYSSGKEYTKATKFKSSNLKGPYEIKTFTDMV